MGLIVYAWGPLEASSASPASSPSSPTPSHDHDPSAPSAGTRRPLPSLDPACLAAITFLSLANANFSVIESNDPALSESGSLPVLRDETSFFHGLDQVLARKSDRSLALDADLTPAQRADAVAVKALVVDKLNDVLQFSWYIDPRNSAATSNRFAGLMSLPSRWMHMRGMRKTAVLRINARVANEWAGPLLLGPVHRPTVRLTPTAAVSASEVAARAAEESAASVSAAARRRSSGMSTSAATFGTGMPRSGSRTPAASDLGRIPEDQRLSADACSELSTRSASPLSKSSPTVAAPLGTFKPPTISLDDEICVLSADDTMHIARRVYATLATLLGDRPYLLGDRPHSLDAIVFGYLALHYYPILPTDANGSSANADSGSSSSAGPQSLASLLLSDFPTLVAYLDRVYAAARISAVNVERTLPSVTSMVWATAKDAVMRVPRALTREKLRRSGLLQTVASIAVGAAILVGYVAVVKANEARQIAEAVKYAQAVARQRKMAARSAQVQDAEEEEDEEEEDGVFGDADEEEDDELAGDEDEYYDDDDE